MRDSNISGGIKQTRERMGWDQRNRLAAALPEGAFKSIRPVGVSGELNVKYGVRDFEARCAFLAY